MPLNPQDKIVELGSLLDLETSHLGKLLGLLDQERQHILDDPEILSDIAINKHKQIETLEQLTIQHNRLLEKAGHSSDYDGMTAYIEAYDINGQLQKKWDALLANIADCQEQNLKNGALVELSRNRLAQLVDILHGDQASTSTYDQAGKNEVNANELHRGRYREREDRVETESL